MDKETVFDQCLKYLSVCESTFNDEKFEIHRDKLAESMFLAEVIGQSLKFRFNKQMLDVIEQESRKSLAARKKVDEIECRLSQISQSKELRPGMLKEYLDLTEAYLAADYKLKRCFGRSF